MPETANHLKRAGLNAPSPGFDLEDVRARRERRERYRRVRAGVLGAAIMTGLVVGSVALLGSSADPGVAALDGGTGLPVAPQPARALEAGEYSYQRLWLYEACPADISPTAGCAETRVRLESWWALDDSGRIEVTEKHEYGVWSGDFGPGEFPDEGDLSRFPTDPDALEAFLLDRSAPDGASPVPQITPAPDVPLEHGLLWNAIEDYLGSTQYLNATPGLRVAMLRVLAGIPIVQVGADGKDPLARPAHELTFEAYGADVTVFVDPSTGDMLATTERYDDGTIWITVVEEAGFTATDDAQPRGEDRTVAPV